jgi:hypothetical protein
MSTIDILFLAGTLTALLAVELPELVHAVIALALSGICLCASLFLLGKPELTLLPLALEIALMVYLVREARQTGAKTKLADWPYYLSMIVFSAAFMYVCLRIFKFLPEPGKMEFVLLGSRIYNAIGVLAVLFAACVGALSLFREDK